MVHPMDDNVEANSKSRPLEQQTSCNSQHSASIVSAVTTKSDHAASPHVAGNSVHSSPCLEPRARQDATQADSSLSAALHNVLARNLASDFVDGLRPVLHDGKLQISTFIQLAGAAEPVFIGLYPSLPAAVQAQKQSQQLVGSLPATLALKLIEAQLEHTASQQQPQQPRQRAAAAPPGTPSRWLSSNSDVTSGALGQPRRTSTAAGEDFDDLTPHAAHQEAASEQRQQLWLSHTRPPCSVAEDAVLAAVLHTSRGTPAPAVGAAVAASPASQSVVAAMAGPSRGAAAAPQPPLAALTDDVINLLLHKGLHALAAVQHRDNDASGEWGKQQAEGAEPQLAAAGAAAPARRGVPYMQQLPPYAAPYAAPQMGDAGLIHPAAQESGRYSLAEEECCDPAPAPVLPGRHHLDMAAALNMGPAADMGPASMAMAGAGAADYLAEYPAAMQHQLYADPPYSSAQNAGRGSLPFSPEGSQNQTEAYRSSSSGGGGACNSIYFLHQHHLVHQRQQREFDLQLLQEPTWGVAAMPKRTYQPPPLPSYGLGAAAPSAQDVAHAAAAVAANGGAQGVGPGHAAAAAADEPHSRGASDAGGYASYRGSDWGSSGGNGSNGGGVAAGGGLKRKRSDPRLNCIKSVQYRVSRFPPELHDLCVEHWERSRCARVVCNTITGVMSVQGGRCVVSFNQHGQEVLKGVADYLRYAGEERIKKWRRHVRMVDFPRPNNRTGELMTAEEFLCIVGYQSEQGGGRRAKYHCGEAQQQSAASEGPELGIT